MNKAQAYKNADEAHKMSTLFNRATCSSSNREKNQLLTQLRNISIDHIAKYEKVLAQNSIRSNELASLKKNYTELQKKLDKTKEQLNLNSILTKRGIKSDKNRIISIIQKVEEELKSMETLERPELLEYSINKSMNEDLKPILLWDIEMQRYEELIYYLQKRIISVEENQECSESIMEEFGSVFGLIDEYKTLSIENQKLKKEEIIFLNDPLVRRRNSSSITPLAARNMITLFQKELESQNSILSILKKATNELVKSSSTTQININPSLSQSKKSRIATSVALFNKTQVEEDSLLGQRPNTTTKVDFNEMCSDPNFKMSTTVTIKPSGHLDSAKKVDLPINEAIQAIQNSVKEAEDQLKKVESDLWQFRRFVIPQDFTAGSRYQKLVELNTRLMKQIQGEHIKIDIANDSIVNLLNQIQSVVESKNYYQKITASIFEPYRALLKDYFELFECYLHNESIGKALSCVTSKLYQDVLNHDATQQQIYNYLQTPIDEYIAAEKLQREKEKETNAKEKPKPFDPKRKISNGSRFEAMQTKLLVAHKKGFQSSKESLNSPIALLSPSQTPKSSTNLSPREVSSSKSGNNSTTFLQKHCQDRHLVRMLAQVLATRLAECHGLFYKVPCRSHQDFVEVWKVMEDQFARGLRNKLVGYELAQVDMLSKIRLSSKRIIVREKANIETMTLPEEKIDVATQWEEQKKNVKSKPTIVKPTTTSSLKKKK
ncbi:hypothetical protein TRFO_15816 [Tritrichomonas foetus]|uniref:Uncharacterized protein n=1 Tax=Tritrichomonas foetus TaxID=1144522 RepID=A0A1J4KRK3_9EUKA|nr:hypothetical protein TRFO_15816 [Tritrichomonas foetus]|eukprot:OHT13921.1 hypothetical protein TRFO_15816 [Tritrichomonas foetus]